MHKKLIGIGRCRNESLIAAATIKHFSEFCDSIIIFDDASEDNTIEIVKEFEKVEEVLQNKVWNPDQTNIQGKQRETLFDYAKFKHPNSNYILFDFDEVIDFDFEKWDGESAVILRLFDARMVEENQEPYTEGSLKDFRKYFDPQFREIPFIFNDKAKYIGVACERYPQLDPNQPVIHSGFCQHYGKALSKQHWQDTCEYYAKYLPIYSEKWEKRKKESGVVSSEGLLTWEEIKLQ